MCEGKFFVIRSQLNGLVLDIKDNSCSPGNPVVTWEQNGGDNQLWYEDAISGVIRSKVDDSFVLEIQDNTLVVSPFCPDAYMQRWQAAGDRVMNRDNPSMVFDIADTDSEPGARVCSWDFHGGPNQLWSFEYQTAVYCYIRSELNCKVMDVKGGDSCPDTKVIMYERKDGQEDNQLWWEDRYGVIRSKLTGFALDTSDGSARMRPYGSCNASQQWVKVANKILNKLDRHSCLDIRGANPDDGAKLIAYEYSGQSNQHWSFDYV